MDTDSNYIAFLEDSIEKLIKPHMREEYKKDKYNFLPSESNELHPTFQVDGVRFTYEMYDKRKPGLFKEEKTTDKLISLCSKMYCCSDLDEKEKPKLANTYSIHHVRDFSSATSQDRALNPGLNLGLNKLIHP